VRFDLPLLLSSLTGPSLPGPVFRFDDAISEEAESFPLGPFDPTGRIGLILDLELLVLDVSLFEPLVSLLPLSLLSLLSDGGWGVDEAFPPEASFFIGGITPFDDDCAVLELTDGSYSNGLFLEPSSGLAIEFPRELVGAWLAVLGGG
jgi:hypothetical protein